MQEFITSRREEIAELCRKHHVRRLAIFGSALRDDFDATQSDVDVLVEFAPIGSDLYFDNKSDLLNGLTEIFGRKVDLLTWKSLDNPYFIREIEATQELLYAA